MKKKLLIPILMITPWLFMANSPAPWQPPQEYDEFQVIDLSFADGEYEINIENTGSKYIVVDHLYFYAKDEIITNPDVYNDLCLAPGDSGIYKGKCDGVYTVDELDIRAYAVEVEGLATYTSVKFEKESPLEYTKGKDSSYFFNLEGVKVDKNYRWFSVVDLTIKGERFVYYSTDNITSGFSFINESGLTESDIQVENIYLVRGRAVDKVAEFFNGLIYVFIAAFASAGVFGGLGVIFLMCFAVFMVFIGIPGIILLIVKPWKKRVKKE